MFYKESRDSLIPGIPGGKLQRNKFYIRVPENHIAGSVSAWLGITGKGFKFALICPFKQTFHYIIVA